MACEKASLKLDMKEVVLVKPSNPTPSSVLSMSTLDNRPDLNSLCQTVHVYRSANHDTPNGQVLDPVHVIKEALSKVLLYYYPLAGRLVKHVDGKLRVNCNADGVPFLEAIANCDLTSLHYLDGTDTKITKHLVFHLSNSQEENGYQYPMVFQVTKFLCGGFTIGIGVLHSICDGYGASQFFTALAELASGKSEPSVKPVWDRERLVGTITKQPLQSPMDEACAAVSPFLPTTVLMHECFKVDSESIRRLKMSMENESFTTFESLAAYVWRSRARALKLSYDGKTMLDIMVGVRPHLLDSPLPDGYYGNAIVDANVVLTVRELNERPLSEIVKLIKETKNVAFTTDYIRNTINTLETKQEDHNMALTTLTEWKHLGFLERVDFGWEEPVNIIPAPCDLFQSVDLCIFASPNNFDPSMKGGVRIFSSLPIAAMPKFREEMEALRSIKP
ncbi:spermidine coumaroyl-CoA acyltransferase-like [Gastrolobium bilobum]|uniref:spermidine coumaroyl-CoA acyltransferase-like n=1 Tax=Gastrolobium bilobum TaxID=150636 RepID=UPI002AB113B0|nr:spermidine coumaroyl-CoA acyltransferase-like [Gastrolobium bilobum]